MALVPQKKIYKIIKENYLVRKGGEIEEGGKKKEKVKHRTRKR